MSTEHKPQQDRQESGVSTKLPELFDNFALWMLGVGFPLICIGLLLFAIVFSIWLAIWGS